MRTIEYFTVVQVFPLKVLIDVQYHYSRLSDTEIEAKGSAPGKWKI